MSIRNLRVIGDDLLKKRSREVNEINDRILELLDDMAETMRNLEGVGLAAPQVGVLRRVAVVDVGDGLIELINPEIIHEEGEETCVEGCLSVPDFVGEVRRPAKVTVRFLNRSGEETEITAEGYKARAICHEIDHLDGILFVDRAENLIEKEKYNNAEE